MRLLVDLGGTNARCAIANNNGEVISSRSYSNDLFDGVEPVLRQFLDEFCSMPNDWPDSAAMAIAGPVQGDEITLTNRGWRFSRRQLRKNLSLDNLIVANDFTANAMALPRLNPVQYQQVGGGHSQPGKPIGVLGPGTGLGVSGLVFDAKTGQWTALSGEGGHVTLAAMNDEEAEVIAYLRRRFGHLSAERVISGAGLVTLYHVVASIKKADAVVELAEVTPVEVTTRAKHGDETAVATMHLFFNFIGTVASDLALTLGAGGGVYLAGGILPRVRDEFLVSGFRERFEDKGRYCDYLKAIPTYLITQDVPAFIGLNALLDQGQTTPLSQSDLPI